MSARWEEILSIAARLFRKKGYRATKLEDIAEELNITKPALYYYINSKHDLLFAICETAINSLLEEASQVVSLDIGNEEKMKRLIHYHINMFANHGDITHVYLADESELPNEQREKIRNLSKEYETTLKKVLELGVREKVFRPLNVSLTAKAISGMCNWLSDWYRDDGELNTDEIAEIYYDLLLNGCKKHAAAEKNLITTKSDSSS